MTTGTTQKTINVQVPEGFDLQVEFTEAGGQLLINGQSYSVNENGLVLPSNDHQTPNFAQRVLEVGQRLRDGTLVLSVDLDKDEALLLPAKIFGGKAQFGNQDDVVRSVNNAALHGHSDWRRITDDEGKTLADNWAKVTTQDPEWFWLASPYDFLNRGRVRCSGDSDYIIIVRDDSNLVPVVRSGPARVCEPV